jgi:hypothetical protein
VIHRDIKPGNIIRRPDGSFCLVDFGSVRDGLRPEGGSTVVGTFGYMAPEQFQGRALPATDVYAVGALLLALITGKSPEELPHQGLGIDAPAALAHACPPAWVDIISQMVNINPDQRPSSLALLVKTLDQGQPAASTRGSRQSHANVANEATQEQGHEQEPDAGFTVMVGSGFGLLPLLALTIARIAIWFVLGVAVPLILYVLALFFGARLRAVASHVAQAGYQARERLREVAGHLQRAEPFLLQGRHYRHGRRRYRGFGPMQPGWRHSMRDWRDDAADWRQHLRVDVPGFDDERQDQRPREHRSRRDERNRG